MHFPLSVARGPWTGWTVTEYRSRDLDIKFIPVSIPPLHRSTTCNTGGAGISLCSEYQAPVNFDLAATVSGIHILGKSSVTFVFFTFDTYLRFLSSPHPLACLLISLFSLPNSKYISLFSISKRGAAIIKQTIYIYIYRTDRSFRVVKHEVAMLREVSRIRPIMREDHACRIPTSVRLDDIWPHIEFEFIPFFPVVRTYTCKHPMSRHR